MQHKQSEGAGVASKGPEQPARKKPGPKPRLMTAAPASAAKAPVPAPKAVEPAAPVVAVAAAPVKAPKPRVPKPVAPPAPIPAMFAAPTSPTASAPVVTKPEPKPEPIPAPLAAAPIVASAPAPEPAAVEEPAPVLPAPPVIQTSAAPVAAVAPPVAPAPEPVSPAVAPAPVIHAAEELKMDATTTMYTTADKAQAMFGDWNDRTKTAVEKSTKMIEEANEFAKGNIEAVVESGRIAAKGVEALGQDAADYGRKSLEQATSLIKSFATVKSPAEFMKLQSDFMRSSFDAMVAETSRSTEAMLKLAGEVAQPLSNRIAVAADKVRTVA
jgi:phasin family protein